MIATRPGSGGVRRGAVRVLAVAAVLALVGCTASQAGPEAEPTVAEPTETEPDPEPEPEPDPEPEPNDELPRVHLGGDGADAGGWPGQWDGLLVIDERGPVVLESVAETAGASTALTLTGPDGELYADAEEAREGGAGRFNDAHLYDPLVIRTLDPGEYHVHIRGFANEPGLRDYEDGDWSMRCRQGTS